MLQKVVILVQQVTSGCFWDSNQWVPEMDSARRFATSGEAIEFCVKRRLRGVRLVLHFDEAQDDIYMAPFRDREVEPLDMANSDADAKLAELAAIKESMREQETRLQNDIDEIAHRMDTLNQRLRFAEKTARLREDNDRPRL
jgi:hypothetical protein